MKNKNKLIPKLRFPEFVNCADWEEKQLGKISEIKTGTSNRQDSTEEEGIYTFFDRSQDVRTSNKFLFDTEAIIVAGEGQEFKPKYFIGKFDLHQRAYAIMNFENEGIGKFLFYYIHKNRSYFLRYAVGSTVKSLRLPIFEKMPIFIPSSQKEQQKIANCLFSLDKLVSAESEKLDHLKDHKKGLLQQLFPQAGEKVPKLRFKEFENDGDWEKSSLKEISPSIFDGTHQTPKYTKEGIPFYSVENIVSGSKNKFISREDYLYETGKNKPEYGDVLITRIGSIGIPKVVDWRYEFSVYVTLAVVKKSSKFNPNYLSFYIQSERFQYEIKRKSLLNATPQKINMNELRLCEILLPPNKEEQQKIANCLSSVDELIEAQAKRIETLKAHKKGLMQQLFPNIISYE